MICILKFTAIFKPTHLQEEGVGWNQWLMPITLATQKAEIRRITV
jgi:hypothetical protein